MKKILSIIIAIMLAIMPVGAAASDFVLYPNQDLNYTADYTFSLDLGNQENLFALLDELGVEESDKMGTVNWKTLIKSIFPIDSDLNLQVDMSRNYRKIKMALVSDDTYSFALNDNLNISIGAYSGMWMNIDLNAETPVYEIIYSSPANSKYGVIDLFELIPDEESKAQIMKILDLSMNSEYINSANDFITDLVKKYADISVSGSSYTIKIDNDAFISILKEYIPFSLEMTASMLETTGIGSDSLDLPEFDVSILDNIKILGDKGITYKYSLISGKLSRMETTCDIEINFEEILMQIAGFEWPFEADGIIKLSAKSTTKFSKHDKTTVQFPTLTEENSFNLSELVNTSVPEYDYTEEYEVEYPYWMATAYFSELIETDDGYYVPLRALLEDAYEDSVTIDYFDGIISAYCEYFTDFNTLTLKKDSTIAYLDGTEIEIPKVIVKDGKTYVSVSFFEDIFGWELSWLDHDILHEEYYVEFYTSEI